MGFVDTLFITIKSGNGGHGKVSFRREKFVAKGGPDGGDGGDGGNVLFKASKLISTFLDLSKKKVYKAQHGNDGKPKKQTGKSGAHCIIYVPCGTCIYNAQTNELLSELTHHNDTILVAKGGKGGKGNVHFSSSRIQTPKKSTLGKQGETLDLNLELKIIADVGLIGYPNAGKSTLLKTITQANPKIASYPFTTLHPNLGIFRQYNQEVIIADIPGIIEGAAEGIGLGNQFLRHISRTNILLFLIEPTMDKLENTRQSFEKLTNELKKYDPILLKRKQLIIAINKIDLLTPSEINELTKGFKPYTIIKISCFLRKGIEKLEQRILQAINETNCN